MFYRLIKPIWGKKELREGEPNPEFVAEVDGPNIYEGFFDDKFIRNENVKGYNVYFFPNHPSTNVYATGKKFLSGKDIDVFNYLFVDMDLKDGVYASKEEFYNVLNSFELKPTQTIDSGNGVHAYWRITDLTREAYVILQLSFLHHFKTDESVWTTLQLMRVPGSLNTKNYYNRKLAELKPGLSSGNAYTLSDIPPKLFIFSKEIQTKADNHLAKLDGRVQVALANDINVDELPDSFVDLMAKNEMVYKLFTDPKGFYGDRSRADMKLVNILYSSGMSKNDALATIANSQKALAKGPNRMDYALGTVDKAYVDRTNNKFMTVGQQLKRGFTARSGDPINGPVYLDTGVLGNNWIKKQVMGVIAGPGVGKTTMALKVLKEVIENNPHCDDVYIFFSLEMPVEDIIDRWILLVGKDSPLADRLYVIGNEDENGDPRNIGLQEILEYTEDIKKCTGKKVGSIVVDHVGILSTMINISKKYKFGVEQEKFNGHGNIRTLTMNALCTQLKSLAKMLDAFLIVLTQTTKTKGVGDLPIDKDGAYGISQYENIMDYIITVWQPLMRIQNMTPLRFMAWQYVKIRNKHKLDKIHTHEQKLLYFDISTGDLRAPTQEEYHTFTELLPAALEARERVEKKQSNGYTRSLDLAEISKKLDGLQIVSK